MKFVFWLSIVIIIYTYIGYGFFVYILLSFKRFFKKKNKAIISKAPLPDLCLIIPAYNEEKDIVQKIANCQSLKYPKHQLQIYFITDGSTDKTKALIEHQLQSSIYPIKIFHQQERKGKIAAIKRIMPMVESPIAVFTDANTLLNANALENLARHFQNAKIGAVAGEKRIIRNTKEASNRAGEGMYWLYESKLKQWDAAFYSVVGAAGELFAIRTELFEPIPNDTIIEDCFLTLRIAQKGYRVAYAPDAYALESPSVNIKEELKRKIRISAGGLQLIYRLRSLLNPIKYGWLSFQYISHRVLRWTLAPALLPILFVSNIFLVFTTGDIYKWLLILQLLFYTFALLGHLLAAHKIKVKVFFIPYYFCIMNYAVYLGFAKIVQNRQSVLWERAERAH